MGLFTRLEREEIAALERDNSEREAQLAAQESAHLESVEFMAQRIAGMELQLATLETELINTKAVYREERAILAGHHEEQVRRMREQAETAGHLATVELARREGAVGELRMRGQLLDMISQQHTWVRDGQCSSHGVRMDVWKCEHCATDPQANMRVLLPAGTRWRAVQDE